MRPRLKGRAFRGRKRADGTTNKRRGPIGVLAGGLFTGLIALGLFLGSGAPAEASNHDACPNAEFREGVASKLPNCRGYEQVTPVDKNNKDGFVIRNFPEVAPVEISENGNRVRYFNLSALSSANVNVNGNDYLAERTGTGEWSSKNLNPAMGTQLGVTCYSSYMQSNPSLTLGTFVIGARQNQGCTDATPPLVPGAPEGVRNLFVRDNGTDTYRLVSKNPVSGPPADIMPRGQSEDLSTVVFQSSAELVSGAPSGTNLYKWTEETDSLELVAIVDGIPVAGADLGYTTSVEQRRYRAVSSDGSRIYFTVNGNLYLDDGSASAVQVDESQVGGPGGGGKFMTASMDGRTAYFLAGSASEITLDTEPGSGENLYRYQTESGQPTNVAPDTDVRVLGTVGTSEDGEVVYFVALGALEGDATPGEPNLYVADSDSVEFIATLQSDDSCVWNTTRVSDHRCGIANLFNPSSRVSSDGNVVAFQSRASLTGYDNRHVDNDQEQVLIYLYDRAAGDIKCASCRPNESRPTGQSWIFGHTSYPSQLIGRNTNYLRRNLSVNGSRIFFTSTDAIVPRDTNERADVYMYENGAVHLISTGRDSTPSQFLDATPDGDSVLFGTRQRLVAQDRDDAMDVYVARVGGGMPITDPPKIHCEGEECQGDVSAPPDSTHPSSAVVSGRGNVAPPEAKNDCVRQIQRFRNFRQVSKRFRSRVTQLMQTSDGKIAVGKRRQIKQRALQLKRHRGVARKAVIQCRRGR